jgi:hypothetical protein
MCTFVITLLILASLNFIQPVESFSIRYSVPGHISTFCQAAKFQLMNSSGQAYLQDLRDQFSAISICRDNYRLWFFQSLDISQVEDLAILSFDSAIHVNELLVNSKAESAKLSEALNAANRRELEYITEIQDLEYEIKRLAAKQAESDGSSGKVCEKSVGNCKDESLEQWTFGLVEIVNLLRLLESSCCFEYSMD